MKNLAEIISCGFLILIGGTLVVGMLVTRLVMRKLGYGFYWEKYDRKMV